MIKRFIQVIKDFIQRNRKEKEAMRDAEFKAFLEEAKKGKRVPNDN